MKTGRRVGAVVLAAGASRRMGGPKLEMALSGRPLVAWAVDAARASVAEPVWVVLGHRADGVRAALADRSSIRFTEAESWSEGLAGSLRASVQRAWGCVDGLVVLLGDMPFVRTETINEIVYAFERSEPGAGGVAPAVFLPTFEGRRGNPVLWSSEMFPELCALRGDAGGRALFERHAARIRRVDVDDPGVLFDVDTPGDLGAASKGSTSG
jgi:molybdenum cofactor cytidylyltransferase